MKRILLLLSLLVVIVTEGTDVYAQTVLTDVWKDKDHRVAVKKITVFWIAQVAQNRLLAENEFVRQLKERGLIATPAYVVIPPDKLVEKDAAITKIKNLGADAVLILRMTDKITIQTSIAAPGTADRSRLSGYYAYAYDAPVKDASDTAFLETNLFDARTEQRIWTARSVTKVDVIDQKALSDFIKIMIDRLALDGMIP
jgi:hypothetical protein